MITPAAQLEIDAIVAEMPEPHPCCPKCGERLRGLYDLTIGVCGLCKDDEVNKRAKENGNVFANGRWTKVNETTGKERTW